MTEASGMFQNLEAGRSIEALNRRILVIDDNAAIHEDFRKIFHANEPAAKALAQSEAAFFGECERESHPAGFEMDSAFQGQEALERVCAALERNRPYAMAFMDMRMPPGWDGIETATRLWGRDPELQIVLCTAYSDYSWERMHERLGRSDRLVILKKPFDNVEVLQLADALTEKWRLARQAKARLTDLEDMVDARTRDLQATNAELNASNQQLAAATQRASDMAAAALAASEQVRLLSITDGLVGTYNRRYLNEQLVSEAERTRRYGRPLSVVMADLDRFKHINDQYGHQVGDEVLQYFVVVVKSAIRQSDWIARYGGEEFVIVLPDTDLAGAVATAERIRERCSAAPLVTSKGQVTVSASFGVAALETPPEEPVLGSETLLRSADTALYQSKREGRNRVTAG